MHTSILKIRLPEHRIEYTGVDAKEARFRASLARGNGRTVTTEKVLVTGSSTLFHYTVISQEAK